jgi:Ca2+-binding EF-hand superfamily protein
MPQGTSATNSPPPRVQAAPAAPPQPKEQGGNGLPNADQIIKALDKNGDGMLDRSEAVDQLAANFNFLDKNRDGKLSKQEIENGLRLARLFGVKPMKPPASYAPPKQ